MRKPTAVTAFPPHPTESGNAVRRRLGAWRSWLVLVGAVVVALGLAWADYQRARRQLRDQLGGELSAMSDLKLKGIEWWRLERFADARHFQSLAPILALFRPYLESVEADPARRRSEASLITAWMGSLCGGAGYTSVRLVDRHGRVAIAYPPEEAGLEAVETVWVAEAMRTRETSLRDLDWVGTTNAPRVDSIVPVVSGAEAPGGVRPEGALLLRCEVNGFYSVLLASWPLPVAGTTYLLRSEGGAAQVLSYAGVRPELASAASWLATSEHLDRVEPVGSVRMAAGEDAAGRAVLALIRPVPGFPWYMVAQVGRGLAEAPLRRHAQGVGWITFAWGLALTAVWGWVARQRDNLQLERELVRRQERQALIERSEVLNRTLVEHLPQRVFLKDLNSVYVACNANHARALGVPGDRVVGHTDADFHPPEEAARQRSLDLSVLATGKLVEREDRSEGPGGPRWAHVLALPYRDAAGRVLGVLGIGEDITPRKEMEEALRASLAEKDALLKEVHHRVKNNLQIVSSLLHLQSVGLADEAAVQAFRTTEARVRSMALLHETLYRSGNLARVDVAQYLASLCAHLGRCFGLNPSRTALVREVPEDGLALDLDLALPCGLIINELVSNALKHAFPDGRVGQVRVRVQREAEAHLLLEVVDNGVGLPADFDFLRARSLGLQLVQGLAAQLGGEASLQPGSEGGVTGRVRFRSKPAEVSGPRSADVACV